MVSVSRRLLIAVSVLLVLFLGAMALVLDARFRAIADGSLRELLDAQILALIASAEPDQAGIPIPRLADTEARLATPGSGLYAAVQDQDGEMLWRSPSASGSLEQFGASLAPGAHAFRRLKDSRGHLLSAVSRGFEWEGEGGGARRLTFSVASSLEGRTAQVASFRRGLLGGFALVAGMLLIALAGLLRWALRPLRRLASQITRVERGEMEQLDARWPSELSGVVGNLNRLLSSERTRITRYRETLGNLAHSLKTPLAVLRSSISGSTAPAQTVDEQVERMSRIVAHQLRRAGRGGAASVGAPAIGVLPLAQDLRGALLRVHGGKDFALELDIPPELQFTGDRDDLMEMMGNLMDNAAKWCASRVRVTAALAPGAAPARLLQIRVEDDGAGIADADRQMVLERGGRADEQVPGHGLGLAMVRETVDLYGGALIVGVASLGGARLEIQLPGRLR